MVQHDGSLDKDAVAQLLKAFLERAVPLQPLLPDLHVIAARKMEDARNNS